MAFPSDAQRAKQRREEERQRQREEERRQAELERRQEAEREREREEERRQEALRQTQEFEAALEAEQERRAAFLARFRQQKRAERRSSERGQVRGDLLRDILRAANRQERNEGRNQAEQESARRAEQSRQSAEQRQNEQRQAEQEAERRQAARQAQRQGQREAARGAEQAEARREEARQSRREQQPEPERDAGRTEARRDAAREQRQEEERADERAAARAAEARDARREEAVAQAREQTRAGERRETQRQEQQDTRREDERREEAREARQQEQRDPARQAEQAEARRDAAQAAGQAEARRDAAQQSRREERRKAGQVAGQAEAQRQSARQTRADEQREAARAAGRAAEARAAQTAQREQRPAPARDPLQARIPSGAISGSLPWLLVNGNQIVNLDCNPVRLRGVSLLGLDSAPPDPERGFAAGAAITEAMIDAILGWSANVIRVAINHQRVLDGSGAWSGWDYLTDLDWIIRRAAEGGAYTMLSLRRLDESTVFGTLPAANGERAPNFIAPQPDYDAVGMWRLLGERYADEPAVLFDLYTSPHGALEDDLTGFDTDWDLWTLWVRLMVAETRLQHPRALCFVSGLNWATDLSGFPVIGTESQPIPNLVYAAHFYPRRDNPLTAMRALARSHPVFVTEWGGGQAEVSWGERTALALRDAGAGWTAAHWNADPPLARTADHRIAPTPFGMVVRRALALTGERAGSVTRTVPARLAVN